MRIVCIDFDGVIHSYTSGWQGADVCPDSPVPGAFDALNAYVKHFRVAVFSSRSAQVGGIEAMKAWFERYGFDHGVLEFPVSKPAAFMTLDDRAVTFMGEFPNVDQIVGFRTWQQALAANQTGGDMEKEVDVKSIVNAYLVTHGYDGLYEIGNGCACKLSDLMPCDQPHQSCKPGHVISYNGDDGFVWSDVIREDENGFVIGER